MRVPLMNPFRNGSLSFEPLIYVGVKKSKKVKTASSNNTWKSKLRKLEKVKENV